MSQKFFKQHFKKGENLPPLQDHHICNKVVHPVTGETITKYKKLILDPLLQDTWIKTMCRELDRNSQGYSTTPGTYAVQFMTLEEIKKIPKDWVITYAHIVVDHQTQKEEEDRVRITTGRNLIDYPDELTTRTADLITTKIL